MGFSLEKRKSQGKNLWLHESGPAIVLGALLGLAVADTSGGNHILEISDSTFFYFVLPPIIFAQGYGLKKRNFFKYFPLIMTFGVIGTFIQFVFMTGCLFLLSSLFDVKLNESSANPEGVQLTLQVRVGKPERERSEAAIRSSDQKQRSEAAIRSSEHAK